MKQVRDIIVKNTSEMLDNPDPVGIYPTTKFYNNLESEIKQWALEIVGEDDYRKEGLSAGRLAQEDIKIARNDLRQEIRERINK